MYKKKILVFVFNFVSITILFMLPGTIYADECSSLLLTPVRPDCTLDATNTGLFCGGNSSPSNCNLGGSQNILYTCRCDAQGQNCIKISSQDCTQLNNGTCKTVGNPLLKDYCQSGNGFPVFTVQPTNIGPNVNCILNATTSNLDCSISLSATGAPSGTRVYWSEQDNGGLNGAQIDNNSGAVNVGQNDSTFIHVPIATCQINPTPKGTFTFIGSMTQGGPALGNPSVVTFDCGIQNGSPAFNVSPTIVSPNNGCTLNQQTNNYDCSIQINTNQTTAINWNTTSNGLTGATITPSTGTVTASAPQTSVINVPSQLCQNNPNTIGAVTYADTANTANTASVNFSCSGSTSLNPPGTDTSTDFENIDNSNVGQLLSNAAPFFIGGLIIWLTIFH